MAESRLRDILSWATQWCDTSGPHRIRAGVESQCVLIGYPEPTFIVKCFRDRPGHRRDRCAREYRLLQALCSAVRDERDLTAPEPIAMSAELNAYLMKAVPGVPLDRAVTGDGRDPVRIANTLVRGLRAFYEATQEHYGDFQPGNILLSDHQVAMIDPGGPAYYFDEALAAASGKRLAADVGYWTFSVVARSPRSVMESGLKWKRVLDVTDALLMIAAQQSTEEMLTRAAWAAGAVHLNRLASGSARHVALAVGSGIALRAWLAAAERRL